ncbi:MAG: nucleotidyltransferase [Hamadaea sp.]|nr:nucleotidyltransferase [Hamadaea sp.]
MTDVRLSPAPIVATFAAAVRPVAEAVAFYVGGSLAYEDYQLGVSDFDLVAMIAAPLDAERQQQLIALHTSLTADDRAAAKLHCAYVPVDEVDDITAEHLTWAHNELYRRPLTGIARAELHDRGITVYGPPPAATLPTLDRAEIAAAALAELSGYWSGAVAKPHVWTQDVYVDLGLVTLARVEATVDEGRLITKREAIERLGRFGVGPALTDEIRRRRRGETVVLTDDQRVRRAQHARALVADGIERLLSR